MNCRTHEHRHFERTLRSTDPIPGPRLAEGRTKNKTRLLFPSLKNGESVFLNVRRRVHARTASFETMRLSMNDALENLNVSYYVLSLSNARGTSLVLQLARRLSKEILR